MKVKVKYSSTETDDDNSKAKKRPLLNVSSDESDDPGNDFFFYNLIYNLLYLICKDHHKCFYLLYK